MTKAELRKRELEKRKALSDEELMASSKVLFDQLLAHFRFDGSSCIHVFLPISQQKELDTYYFIECLRKRHPSVKIVVPVSDFKTKAMKSALLSEQTVVMPNRYNIPEPVNPIFVNDDEITHVITPLLAIDGKGNRVGYGGGFYDRFFERLNSEVVKIGVLLSDQYSELDLGEDHDIPLDYFVNLSGFFKL